MPCYGCAKNFSIFRSEHACPNCGFGYCKNCLEFSLFVEKLNKKAKVCYKCKASIEKGKPVDSSPIEPPKAFLKRIENMSTEDKTPPIVVYKTGDRFERLKRGLSIEDKAIVERLEKLREDRKGDGTVITDDAIRERLLKLRGEPANLATKSSMPAVDLRSDQQKCDDLLMQYLEECEVEEKKENANKELEERLNKLKGLTPGVSNIPKCSSVEDLTEEEMAARLIRQITSEPDTVEDNPKSDSEISSIKTSEDEELSSEDNESLSDDDNGKKRKKNNKK